MTAPHLFKRLVQSAPSFRDILEVELKNRTFGLNVRFRGIFILLSSAEFGSDGLGLFQDGLYRLLCQIRRIPMSLQDLLHGN
nr:hypothetical protein [Jhaorihella thermophila]